MGILCLVANDAARIVTCNFTSSLVGATVDGCAVGDTDGCAVRALGSLEGFVEGLSVGVRVGSSVGASVGVTDGPDGK